MTRDHVNRETLNDALILEHLIECNTNQTEEVYLVLSKQVDFGK